MLIKDSGMLTSFQYLLFTGILAIFWLYRMEERV